MPAMAAALALLLAGRARAFHRPVSVPVPDAGVVPSAPASGTADDARRREFLLGGVLSAAVATNIRPSRANAAGYRRAATTTPSPISGVLDPRLRDYRTALLPDWTGTALPGPASLSEACRRIERDGDVEPVLSMGRWPDPILRHPASSVPPSVFRSDEALGKLRTVARALRNAARREGAAGLAAQQCGVDASLVFVDGVVDPDGRTKDGGRGRNERGLFLVNPRIVRRSPESEMRVWTEQCLVLPPEFRATLLRDAEVTIEYESLECLDGGGTSSGSTCGTTRQITLQGELARCAQHEMDHDRGTLIVDHVSLDELLSLEGEPVMAKIENADGLHWKRMERAYERDVSASTLLPKDERYVALAMEDSMGYRRRCTRANAERSQIASEDGRGPWWVQSANAIDQTDGASPILATPQLPSGSGAQTDSITSGSGDPVPECDDACLEERRRRVEERRAMMRQSRSSTSRGDVLKLSEQRAALYGTEYKGLSPRTCSRPGFCP